MIFIFNKNLLIVVCINFPSLLIVLIRDTLGYIEGTQVLFRKLRVSRLK